MKYALMTSVLLFSNFVFAQSSFNFDNCSELLANIKSETHQKNIRGFKINKQVNHTFKYNNIKIDKDSIITVFNNACNLTQIVSFHFAKDEIIPKLAYTINYTYPTINSIERTTINYDTFGAIINESSIEIFYNINGSEDSVFFWNKTAQFGKVCNSKLFNIYNIDNHDSSLVYKLDQNSNTYFLANLEVKKYNSLSKKISSHYFNASSITDPLIQFKQSYTTYGAGNAQSDSSLIWISADNDWQNERLITSINAGNVTLSSNNYVWSNVTLSWDYVSSIHNYYSNNSSFDSSVITDINNVPFLKSFNSFDADGNNNFSSKQKLYQGSFYTNTIMTRDFVICKPLAIDNILSENKLSIYPNPVINGSELYIETPYKNGFVANIYDVYGKLVANYIGTSATKSIHIDVKQGIYLLKIKDNYSNAIHTQKLIVQ